MIQSRHSHLKINGMHCTGCEDAIENAVSGLPGVRKIKADPQPQPMALIAPATAVFPPGHAGHAFNRGDRLMPPAEAGLNGAHDQDFSPIRSLFIHLEGARFS